MANRKKTFGKLKAGDEVFFVETFQEAPAGVYPCVLVETTPSIMFPDSVSVVVDCDILNKKGMCFLLKKDLSKTGRNNMIATTLEEANEIYGDGLKEQIRSLEMEKTRIEGKLTNVKNKLKDLHLNTN